MSTAGAGARDQVTRLLALVPYLQARGEISVADAARDFGVSARTIRRDINVLMFCGLPGLGMGDLIEVDFDALDGQDVIRLSNADYLARPLRLDSTEAAALVAGLRALLEGSEGTQREVVERTLHKIEEAAGEAARSASRIELRRTGDRVAAEVRESLDTAVSTRRQVRIVHRSAARDALTERVVDPLAISVSEGNTYLDGWCHLVEDRRLFRLDRITEAEVLDRPVEPRADLEPLDLREGIFRPDPDTLRVTVRLEPRARWVSEYFPVEEVEEHPDGSLSVVLAVSEPAWMVRLMLRLGDAAVLQDAPAIAEDVTTAARRALALYS